MRVAWCSALAVLCLARPVHADDAATWKARGDRAIDEGRAAEALDAYRHAAAITPSPSLDYNVGRALLATGDFIGALSAFERYEATASDELKRKTHRLADVMAEIRTKIVTVEVVGEAGARVSIDGQLACALPCGPLQRNPGRIDVRVEADERRPWGEQRDLAPGSSVRFDVRLESVPIEAHLVITTRPASATTSVIIDGRRVGVAPVSLALAPGAHDVAFDAASFEPRRTTVVLDRSESRRIDVELTPRKRPITTRWWFWTGIAVAVAGGTAAAIALTTERAESTGSLGTVHVP